MSDCNSDNIIMYTYFLFHESFKSSVIWFFYIVFTNNCLFSCFKMTDDPTVLRTGLTFTNNILKLLVFNMRSQMIVVKFNAKHVPRDLRHLKCYHVDTTYHVFPKLFTRIL